MKLFRLIMLCTICVQPLLYSAAVKDDSMIEKWDNLLMKFAWIYPLEGDFLSQPFFHSYTSNNFLFQTNITVQFDYFEKEKDGRKRYWDDYSLGHYLNAIRKVLIHAGRVDNISDDGLRYATEMIETNSVWYPEPETLFFDDATKDFFLFDNKTVKANWSGGSYTTDYPIVYLKLGSLSNENIYWTERFSNNTSRVNYSNYENPNSFFTVLSSNNNYNIICRDINRGRQSDDYSSQLTLELYNDFNMTMDYSSPYVLGNGYYYTNTPSEAVGLTGNWIGTEYVSFDYDPFPMSAPTNYWLYSTSGFPVFKDTTNLTYRVQTDYRGLVTNHTIIPFAEKNYIKNIGIIPNDASNKPYAHQNSHYRIDYETMLDKFVCMPVYDKGVWIFANRAYVLNESLIYTNLLALSTNFDLALTAGASTPHMFNRISETVRYTYDSGGYIKGSTIEEAYQNAYDVAKTNVHVTTNALPRLTSIEPVRAVYHLQIYHGNEEYEYEPSVDLRYDCTSEYRVHLKPWFSSAYTNAITSCLSSNYVFDVDVFGYYDRDPANIVIVPINMEESSWYPEYNHGHIYKLADFDNIEMGNWYGGVYTNTLRSELPNPEWVTEYFGLPADGDWTRTKQEERFSSIGCYFTLKEKEEN